MTSSDPKPMQTPAHQVSMVAYEYPLNERVRAYLRLEHLLDLMQPQREVMASNYSQYFSALFAILDLCERSDIRTDVQKDLERRKQQLAQWARHPDVNPTQLQTATDSVAHTLRAIQTVSRVGSALKQDRLLSALRQRFAMPGGTCNFDLPQLHYWLNLPQDRRDQDCARWWQELSVLMAGLTLELEMLRGQTAFRDVVAKHGMLQESTDALSLLRLRVPADVPAYPVISGHKARFSIRFLRYEPEQGKASYEHDVPCSIALCP